MPTFLPATIGRRVVEGALPPPILMYLRMLLGNGSTMTDLPAGIKRNLANRTISNTSVGDAYSTLRSDPGADPYNLSYSNYGWQEEPIKRDPDSGGIRWHEMNDPTKSLMLSRTLGSVRTVPVGADSVRVKDRYDFMDDAFTDLPPGFPDKSSTGKFIRFADKWGKPYNIDATIYAPYLNKQLRERALSFKKARNAAMKDRRAELDVLFGKDSIDSGFPGLKFKK